jgi:hypothetical protein
VTSHARRLLGNVPALASIPHQLASYGGSYYYHSNASIAGTNEAQISAAKHLDAHGDDDVAGYDPQGP